MANSLKYRTFFYDWHFTDINNINGIINGIYGNINDINNFF